MKHHGEEKSHRCPKCPASFNIPVSCEYIHFIIQYDKKLHQVIFKRRHNLLILYVIMFIDKFHASYGDA